jgi:hypothetical protein
MHDENHTKKSINDGRVTSSLSAHPVGSALGAVGGVVAGVSAAIVTGAAVGSAIGPLGAAIGAIIGGEIGIVAGHEIAAEINPKSEDLFWRENYITRPYVIANSTFDNYQPAYLYGIESYAKYPNRNFGEIEMDVAEGWHASRGDSTLDWPAAKQAVQDAYERLKSYE